ncbi:hypothetical protein [Streptacidiphilus albus]|uniref:hypothetical protein n=1 Tax=Streptacidiphilus albus TaxID=105425 RepID=UPI00128D15A4|nr:hypothetical protein [Streptacidiphilus albus]
MTIWRLKMDTPLTVGEKREIMTDIESGFQAVLSSSMPGELILQVNTERPAMSPEYYPLTFSSFRIVNDEIGPIETIEGLPRDWYAPFRSRRDSAE